MKCISNMLTVLNKKINNHEKKLKFTVIRQVIIEIDLSYKQYSSFKVFTVTF